MRLKKLYPAILGAALLGISALIGIESKATITDLDIKTISALGTGSSQNFTIGFDFQDNSQLRVYLQNESVTPVTRTVVPFGAGPGKYTVGGGNPGTTVIMGTSTTSTQRVVIVRQTPLTQPVDYVETEAFPAEDHEEQMDRVTQSLQELSGSIANKIGYSTASTATPPTFPDPLADRFIVWDHSASDLTLAPASSTPVAGEILRFGTSTWDLYDLDGAISGIDGDLAAHLADLANPHQVTATQVGNTTAQWNANKIQGKTVDDAAIGNGKVLQYNSGTGNIEYAAGLAVTLDPNSAVITDGTGALTSEPYLALSRGGTSTALTAAPGAVAYSGASSLGLTAVGASGQFLVSNGTSAPGWSTVSLASSWLTAGNPGLTTPVLGTTDQVSISVRTNGIGRIYLDALTEKMNFLGGLGTDPDDLSGKFNFAGVVSVSPDTQANENGALYLTNESRAPDPVPVGTRQIALFSDDSGTLGLKSDTGSGFKINLTGQITNPDDTFVTMPSAASSASTVWVLEDTAQTLTNKTISFDSNALTGRVSGGTKSIYVSKSGNDSTGDGTYFYPYLTITKALTVATGASAADPYFVYVYPGTYAEAPGFKFKSHVHVMGVAMGGNPVMISSAGGIGSDLLGASPILYIENLQLTSPVVMRPDSTATGGATVKPNHCQFTDTLEVSRSTSASMSFTLENNSFTEGAMTIKSSYVEFDYSFALSSITSTHLGGAALGELGMYGGFFTSISLNNTGASGGSVVLSSSGSYNNGGTISITGTGATLNADADSLPKAEGSVTLAGGATLNRITTAYSIGYTPTVAGNWTTSPTNLKLALDELAARTISTIVGTRGFPFNVVAGTGITFTAGSRKVKAYVQGTSGNVDITANPQVQVGTIDGQELLICGRSGASTVKLENGTGLSLNGEAILGDDKCINLNWDTSVWVETSRNF